MFELELKFKNLVMIHLDFNTIGCLMFTGLFTIVAAIIGAIFGVIYFIVINL